MLTHLSLFSGIGGLDLAAEMAGIKTVGQCEWADYPTKVLEKHWPDVPRWRDIRTLTGEIFREKTGIRSVDIISGGFPCQPFSVAGKRRGKEDDRYLWPEMLRVIQELRPAWVVGENVAGIVNMALDTVLSDLESLGYTCQAFIIPACAVDAAHRRDRCAILAYSKSKRFGKKGENFSGQTEWASCCSFISNHNSSRLSWERAKQQTTGSTGVCETLANINFRLCNRAEKEIQPGRDISFYESKPLSDSARKFKHGSKPCSESSRESGSSNNLWRDFKSGLGGMADGVPSWMDRYWVEEPNIPRITKNKKNRVNRLKCLGNAVYWRQFYPIFQAIVEVENDHR